MSLLSREQLTDLLLESAEEYPVINEMVVGTINTIKAERDNVLDFADFHSLVRERISDWPRADVDEDSYMGFVSEIIQQIQRSCRASPNAQTRFNALSVLCDIGKTICKPSKSSPRIIHLVRKVFRNNVIWEDALYDVILGMSDEEREDISSNARAGTPWAKLLELRDLEKDLNVFQGVAGMVSILGGEEVGAGSGAERDVGDDIDTLDYPSGDYESDGADEVETNYGDPDDDYEAEEDDEGSNESGEESSDEEDEVSSESSEEDSDYYDSDESE